MKKHLLLLILLSSLARFAAAQDRIVSGTLMDSSGEALPGVNVLIKGTTTGTASDANGRYSIKVPLGATLVFSFIGFTTYEVVVTPHNSVSAVPQHNSPAAYQSPAKEYHANSLPGRGVARMGEQSPGFVLKSGNHSIRGLPANASLANGIANAYSIRYLNPRWASLRYGSIGTNGLYVVNDRLHRASPVQVNLTSAFMLDRVNKLPALQQSYAQGRPLDGTETWRGPETGEVFSWGPPLASLEYSGTGYPFDPDGSLVAQGTGNGKAAQAYNPYAFFRTGFTADNSLGLKKRLGETDLDLGLHRKQQQSVIPNAGYSRTNLSLKLNTPLLYRLDADYTLRYSEATGNLPSRGANLAGIMSALLRTPPSFTNTAGFSSGEALKNPSAYQLPGGMPRSYSPGASDNPYWLVNHLPDRENFRQWMSALRLKYANHGWFGVDYTAGIDEQWNRSRFGQPLLSAARPDGRLTNRLEKQTAFHSVLTPSVSTHLGQISLDASSSYALAYAERSLHRRDELGLRTPSADSTFFSDIFRQRLSHEWLNLVNLRYRDVLSARLSNGSYFSSTIPQGKLLMPGAGLNFTFTNLLPYNHSAWLNQGRLFASYGRSLKEAPLVYSQWAYQSTVLPLTEYLGYFEESELAFSRGLGAEMYDKWESGAALSLFSHRVGMELTLFSHRTQHALVPVFRDGQFTLANAAEIRNRGYEWVVQYRTHSPLQWSTKLSLSRSVPVVQQVYGNETRVPIAGFREASANLVAGQPYGVIYGTTYRRNEAGQRIIGPDGFPLVDEELKPIGNPNPDWTAGIDNQLDWRLFSLALVVDIRKGGQVWNGTRNALDYFGTSARSAELRDTRNYIFAGVAEDGSPNTRPVSFADPANGLAGNRWVRYGMTGVGDEAIEDASWVRLNEARISYRLDRLASRLIPRAEARLSLVGKNLLLLTRYSGVDPASTMFGYAAAAGLDFFNPPNTRSYGISLNLTL